MKRLPRILLYLLALLGGGTLRSQPKASLPLYRDEESFGNLYSRSHNPAGDWFSPVGELLDFHMDYGLRRGDLHDVDESSKSHSFGVGLCGRRRFNKVSCFGRIGYSDGKEYARRWNSTLQVSDDNPFILGDSIPSDFNTQRFDLLGRVAYCPTDGVVLGLQLDYDTGSAANQTDPRPRTDGMRFEIVPGIHIRLGHGFSTGLSGGFELMGESITHEIVDPRVSYVYFRFNGLGDYSTISSGTSLPYPRDYSGTEYKGAWQLAWEGGRSLANLLEVQVASNRERARDGGASFTYLGGDYARVGFGLSDRIRIGNGCRRHTVEAGWSYKRVRGIWYEQTAYLDPDRNNELAYRVQASGEKNRERASAVWLAYRFDRLRKARADFSVYASGRYEASETVHYEGDGYMRRYSLLSGSVGALRHIAFGSSLITVSFGLQGGSPLASEQRVPRRIGAVYTDPAFEYLTATWLGGEVSVRYHRLLGALWVGLFAEASQRWYVGRGTYTEQFEGTDARRMSFGVELLF